MGSFQHRFSSRVTNAIAWNGGCIVGVVLSNSPRTYPEVGYLAPLWKAAEGPVPKSSPSKTSR